MENINIYSDVCQCITSLLISAVVSSVNSSLQWPHQWRTRRLGSESWWWGGGRWCASSRWSSWCWPRYWWPVWWWRSTDISQTMWEILKYLKIKLMNWMSAGFSTTMYKFHWTSRRLHWYQQSMSKRLEFWWGSTAVSEEGYSGVWCHHLWLQSYLWSRIHLGWVETSLCSQELVLSRVSSRMSSVNKTLSNGIFSFSLLVLQGRKGRRGDLAIFRRISYLGLSRYWARTFSDDVTQCPDQSETSGVKTDQWEVRVVSQRSGGQCYDSAQHSVHTQQCTHNSCWSPQSDNNTVISAERLLSRHRDHTQHSNNINISTGGSPSSSSVMYHEYCQDSRLHWPVQHHSILLYHVSLIILQLYTKSGQNTYNIHIQYSNKW